jgi:hypothetical protein
VNEPSEVSPPAEWKRRADEQQGLAYSGYAEVAIDTMWTGELSACDTVASSRGFENGGAHHQPGAVALEPGDADREPPVR